MSWRRGIYPILSHEQRSEIVRGFLNPLFGIRYECGIGFRVTHLSSGFLITRQFFRRLRDAVAFCEAITPLADWNAMTASDGLAAKESLGPLVTTEAQRFERYIVTSALDVRTLEPEAA